MTPPATDQQYYQVARPHSLSERVVIAARDRIFSDFMKLCSPRPTDTILDVGVSDIVTDAANLLERLYPYPEMITAVGLGDGRDFRKEYPLVAYQQIRPHESLPFADKSFEIATANAVLEHVGSIGEQVRFVAELTRVARNVFISVPHRYFPVEHHTALPLVHYNNSLFALVCRMTGKNEWSDEKNLILMNKSSLGALLPKSANGSIGFTGLPLGPLSSNLYMHISSTS